MGEGGHKVFLWTSGNRFRPDVTRTVKLMPFPWATSTFVFVGTRGIMKSKVFRREQHSLKQHSSPVCLNRRREHSGEEVISGEID